MRRAVAVGARGAQQGAALLVASTAQEIAIAPPLIGGLHVTLVE